MAKLMICLFALALIAVVSAQGGLKDLAGNYYDLTTGQYSSSLTGRVYNTYGGHAVVAPAVSYVASAPYVASYASPYVSSYASPYVSPYAYGAYSAPLAYGLLKK